MHHRHASAMRIRKLIETALVGLLLWFGLSAQAGASLVVDRHIAYSIGIDPTKTALLPGQTSSGANFTNALGGITELYIDIAGAPSLGGIGLGDLDFRAGNSTDIASWSAPGTAPALSVLAGAGTGGADRLALSWIPGSVENTWLEITLAANATTGLATPDVFYFGHLLGDANYDGHVTPVDVLLINNALTSSGSSFPAGPGNPLDINRDGFVAPIDELIVINTLNAGNVSQLVTLSPPLPQPVPLPAAIWLFVTALGGLLAFGSRRQSLERVRPVSAG